MSTRRSTKRARKTKRLPYYSGVRQTELKHFDLVVGPTAPTVSWAAVAFNALPAQGTDFNQRIGRKIMIMKMDVKILQLATVSEIPVAGTEVFHDIILDHNVRGAVAAESTIYDLTTPAYVSFNNASNKKRFTRLVRTKQQIENINEVSARVQDMTSFTITKRVPVEFNAGATVTIADVIANGFVFTTVCTNALRTPGTASTYRASVRFWFVDH